MRKSLILLLSIGLILVPGCKKDAKKSLKQSVLKKNKGSKKAKIQDSLITEKEYERMSRIQD